MRKKGLKKKKKKRETFRTGGVKGESGKKGGKKRRKKIAPAVFAEGCEHVVQKPNAAGKITEGRNKREHIGINARIRKNVKREGERRREKKKRTRTEDESRSR